MTSMSFGHLLLRWFEKANRDFPWRRKRNPYNILVTEKLLQQTTSSHVMRIYSLFFTKYPDIKALAAVSEKDIQKTIKPLGFHHIRARQLKKMAKQLFEDFSGQVPKSRSSLVLLVGVGNYIADAVLCYAFGMKIVPVDVNVRRVARRFFYCSKETTDEDIKRMIGGFIPKGKAKQFNWALLDFAALICRKNPKCDLCFLKNKCNYYNTSVA